MDICLIGRTSWLLDAGHRLLAAGHRIPVVVTAKHTAEAGVTVDDFHSLADKAEARFFRSIDASRADILECLSSTKPSLALTMNFPGILDERFCRQFRDGVVNCHGSLLPRYRGNAPPNWAILLGDKEVGLTLHYAVPNQLDNGMILLQRAMELRDDLDIGDVYRWFDSAIPSAFIEIVGQIESGAARPVPQDETRATFAFPRRPEDSRLRFDKCAEQLLRLIRASSRPFSGAFCYFEGRERITVWRAERVDMLGELYAVPGQVVGIDKEGRPTVYTANGTLRFLEFSSETELKITRRARFTSTKSDRD